MQGFIEVYGPENLNLGNVETDIALVFSDLKDYDNAIKHQQKACDLYNKSYGEGSLRSLLALNALHVIQQEEAQSLGEEAEREFNSTHMFGAFVVDGGEASKRGYSGLYLWVADCDWNILSDSSIIDSLRNNAGMPRDILWYKDGEIFSDHFDGMMGVQNILLEVIPEERQSAIDAYKKWAK